MKYTVEIAEQSCVETLKLHDGNKYTVKHKKTSTGSKRVSKSFSEQMEADGICEEILDKVYSLLDGFFTSNLIDIAELDS